MCGVFLARCQKIERVGSSRKYDEETNNLEKTRTTSKKSSLPDWEGSKNAGYRCLFCFENCENTVC